MSSSPSRMRPFKSPNRIIGTKEEELYFKHHYNRIKNVKKGSFHDNPPPIHHPSYHTKHWREINAETEKQGFENLHLLSRLARVFDFDRKNEAPLPYRSSLQSIPGVTTDRFSYPRIDCVNLRKEPLEAHHRGRVFHQNKAKRDIMHANSMFIARLSSTKSNYERSALEKEFDKSRGYLKNARKVKDVSPTKQRLERLHDNYLTLRSELLVGTGRISPSSTVRSTQRMAQTQRSAATSRGGDWNPSTLTDRDAPMNPWFRPEDPSTAREIVTSLYSRTHAGVIDASTQARASPSPSGTRSRGTRGLHGPESYTGFQYQSPGSETLRHDSDRMAPTDARHAPPRDAQSPAPRRAYLSPGGPVDYDAAATRPHRVPILASSSKQKGTMGGAQHGAASSSRHPQQDTEEAGPVAFSFEGRPAVAKSRPESRGGGVSDYERLHDLSKPDLSADRDLQALQREIEGGASVSEYAFGGGEVGSERASSSQQEPSVSAIEAEKEGSSTQIAGDSTVLNAEPVVAAAAGVGDPVPPLQDDQPAAQEAGPEEEAMYEEEEFES